MTIGTLHAFLEVVANADKAPARLDDGRMPTGWATITGHEFAVQAAIGTEGRAHELAALAQRTTEWLQRTTGRSASFTLHIASDELWSQVAHVPIAGIPQARPRHVVVPVAAAPWMREFVDVIRARLAVADQIRLDALLGTQEQLTAFIDRVLVHELAHLLAEIDPATGDWDFPAPWIAELYCNVAMCGYLSEHDPEGLTQVLALANATRKAGVEPWAVHELERMYDSLEHGPAHYVWFQMLLILVAEQLWRAEAAQGMRKFRDRLGTRSMSSAEAIAIIATIDAAAAGALRRWPFF